MFKQILAGLEALRTDAVFFCEHDVLYHKSHFDFIPPKENTYYYNEHTYKVDSRTGKAVFYHTKQTSGLCAHRELLIEHYRKRIERVEKEGFSRRMGFEPGSHRRRQRIDDHRAESWMSELPNIDIRHGKNLTPSRWSPEEFRNKRSRRGWKEVKEIPGWGKVKEIMRCAIAPLSPQQSLRRSLGPRDGDRNDAEGISKVPQMESIFISIASYRDHELHRTVQDCLRKARHPERLVFGIHWQHDNHDFFEQTFDRRFRVIDTYYKESKGACWARHEAQKLYACEDYVLQIDSHMRFVPGWDVICIDGIRELQKRGNRKVIISNIMPAYDPADDGNLREVILTHELGDFTKDGIIALKSAQVKDTPEPFSPGQCIAAGFLFSIGDLFREVRIDPNLYFWGEEIAYAVRAYTHGYDMYYCHRPIVYHYYMRNGNRRHWSDHDGWWERDRAAKARVRSLLMETGEVPDLGPYGLGSVRTLADYESYAGVDFKNRIVNKRVSATPSTGMLSTAGKKKVLGLYQVELTSFCNMQCPFCPHPFMKRAKGHMSAETLARCIDHARRGGLSRLVVHHFGEPLMHPQLKERLEQIAAGGLEIQFSSNGLLLEENLDLLLSIPNKIRIALSVNQWFDQEPGLYFKALKEWQDRTQGTNITFVKAFNARETHHYFHKWAHGEDKRWDYHQCFFLKDNWGVVLWNGVIATCCVDHEGESVFSNIHSPDSFTAQTGEWKGCGPCDLFRHIKYKSAAGSVA